MTPTDRVREALEYMRDEAMTLESEEGYKRAIECLNLLQSHVLIPSELLDDEKVWAKYQDEATTLGFDQYRMKLIAPYVGRE